MTYVGFLVSKGTMDFTTALLVSFFGSAVGMSISYMLGRFFGLPLIEKYGKRIGIKETHLIRVQAWYARFGAFVLMIGYFLPGIRHVTAFSAGTSRMRLASFMLYAYPGGFIWALTFITIGRLLGDHWNVLFEYLHWYSWWIFAALLLVAGALLYFRFKKKFS